MPLSLNSPAQFTTVWIEGESRRLHAVQSSRQRLPAIISNRRQLGGQRQFGGEVYSLQLVDSSPSSISAVVYHYCYLLLRHGTDHNSVKSTSRTRCWPDARIQSIGVYSGTQFHQASLDSFVNHLDCLFMRNRMQHNSIDNHSVTKSQLLSCSTPVFTGFGFCRDIFDLSYGSQEVGFCVTPLSYLYIN